MDFFKFLFSWNCISGSPKLFPSSKIDFWPFLKLQKMEFRQKHFREIDLFDFTRFFLDWTFFNFLAYCDTMHFKSAGTLYSNSYLQYCTMTRFDYHTPVGTKSQKKWNFPWKFFCTKLPWFLSKIKSLIVLTSSYIAIILKKWRKAFPNNCDKLFLFFIFHNCISTLFL